MSRPAAGPSWLAQLAADAGQHARGNIFATGRQPHPSALPRSEDGRQWRKITADAPALSGAGQTSCYRYQSLVRARGDLWAYYEASRRDGNHELRGIRLIGRGQD